MEEQGATSNSDGLIRREQLSPRPANPDAIGEAMPRIIDLSPNRNNETASIQVSDVPSNNQNAGAQSTVPQSSQQNRSPLGPTIRVRSLAELQTSTFPRRQPPRPGYSLPPVPPDSSQYYVSSSRPIVTSTTGEALPTIRLLRTREMATAAMPSLAQMVLARRRLIPEGSINAVINLADEDAENDQEAEDMEVDGDREEPEAETLATRNNDPTPSSSALSK